MKWKHLGATIAQPQRDRKHKLMERDHRVCPRLQHLLPSSKAPQEATSAQELFVKSFMKRISMAEQPHTSLRSPCTMPSVGWRGVKLAAIGLWSSGNEFSVVMNHASPSVSPTDKSELGDARRTLRAPIHSDNCKVWWRINIGLGLLCGNSLGKT